LVLSYFDQMGCIRCFGMPSCGSSAIRVVLFIESKHLEISKKMMYFLLFLFSFVVRVGVRVGRH